MTKKTKPKQPSAEPVADHGRCECGRWLGTMSRRLSDALATIERLEQIIYAHSCENALKHDDWELSGEAYAIDERRRAAREKEKTDE